MATIITFPVDQFEPLRLIDLTDAERAVVDLVFGDDALLNPVRPSIAKALASIDNEIASLTPLAGATGNQAIPKQFGLPASPAGPGGLNDTQITALIAALNVLKTAITTYRTHSDRVSGYTLPVGTNPPSFPGLLGVAVAYNLIKNSLEPEGTPNQDFFSWIFYSLLGYAETEVQAAEIATFRIFERLNGDLNSQITLKLNTVVGSFSVNELVDDLTTVKTAKVIDWKPATNTMIITGVDPGDFNAADNIQGQGSGATAIITSVTLPVYNPSNPSATPAATYSSILAAISPIPGKLSSLSTTDDNNYFEALDFITKFGLAQTISSLAVSNEYARYLFNEVNGTPALKREIENLLAEEDELESVTVPTIGSDGELIIE